MSSTDVVRVVSDPIRGGFTLLFEAGPMRQRVLELFYTDELPLPFTPQAQPGEVAADVRRRYPHAEVRQPEG